MPRQFTRAVIRLALCLPFVGLGSCTRTTDYELIEVDGELVITGQPGDKIHIEFVPDAGVVGPTSAADTDAQGKFTLHVMSRNGDSPAGAVIGSHRVTLSDKRLAESADGRGAPIRFGTEYTLVGSTRLR